MQNRLFSLDYLRGIAAFGIMMYHFNLWTFGEQTADTFIERVGIYGVSIFYILSGLTLYYVYYDKMIPTWSELKDFYRKRIYRIFPLLWLVTIISVILLRKVPNFYHLFLNLSGLFGFIKWNVYFSAGMWSIGNELVFYVFFPVFVILGKRGKWWLLAFSILIFGLFTYFTFFELKPNISLDEKQQWYVYVNPLNQVYLFLSGFLMGYFLKNISINNKLSWSIIFVGILLFIFIPVSGHSIDLVHAWARVAFSAICLLVCFGFYKLSVPLPDFLHKPFSKLGEISYSVYLVHPIVFQLVFFAIKFISARTIPIGPEVKFGISVVITLIVANYVYFYFEKYFMRVGARKITLFGKKLQ